MRILVTGGSGLVGRYVVEELRRIHDLAVLDLRKPQQPDVRHFEIDLLDETNLRKTVRDFDAVVHLAGIPHPLNDPPGVVFRTNALGTFNLLEACAENGVRKLIFMSSESVLGFAFSSARMWPLSLPIDEKHPLRPQDPYGLSKLTCELLCSGFTRRTGMQTICLRPPWIWVPEQKEILFYRQLRAEYRQWSKNLWAYIHVLDVAAAVRDCIGCQTLPAHDFYFVCASDNWTGIETRNLVAEFFPETGSLPQEISGCVSLISSAKAAGAFGFKPRYTWRDILL